MKKLIVSVLFFCIPFFIGAETPSVHILWHTDNDSKIVFNCSPVYGDDNQPSKNKIQCDSTTINFFKQEDPDDFEMNWSDRNPEINNMFDADGKPIQSQTNMINNICDPDMLDYLRFQLGQPLKKLKLSDQQKEIAMEKLGAMQLQQIDDLKSMAKTYLNFCKEPSLNSFKEIARNEFDKATRTCRVDSKSLKEIYTKVNDNLWVNKTEGGPLDPCKRISISSLKLPEGGKFYEWEFQFRQIVLDKEAEYLGISCADIEKNSQDLYTNRTNPVFLGCDYISN